MKIKRTFIVLLTTILMFGLLSTSVAASEYEGQRVISREVITYPDGYQLETVIIVPEYDMFSSNTKQGSKVATYRNHNGEALWYVSVTGTFTYTGRRATCTSSVVNAGSYTEWVIEDKGSSYSGATASAYALGRIYFNGVLLRGIKQTVTLTCSVDGVLS